MAYRASTSFNKAAPPKDQEALNEALLEAAEHTNMPRVVELLEQGADANARGSSGISALHWVAAKGHNDLVRLLIAHDADVNAANRNGATPLHFAAWHGNTETAIILMENGGKHTAQYRDGYRPLHSAMWRGYPETALALIDHGADLAAQSVHGETPIDLAIRNFQQETALKVHEVISLRNSRRIKDISLETKRHPRKPKPPVPAP